jgi:hypothetical protein
MHRWFFSVLFSAVLLVLALPLAAGAQEGTAEETSLQANDAAKAGVEATTSNVSAETGNGSSSSNAGSQQSSDVTVSQAQAGEGTQSQAVTGDLNISQNSSSSCQNPQQVGSIDDQDSNDSLSFNTRGNKFRVSYTVDFDSNSNSNEFRIEIKRDNANGTVVDSDSTDVDDTVNFTVSEGADRYILDARIVQGNANYSVTVDDCRGNNDGGNNRHHNNRHNDHNNRHHNRFHHNRFHPNRFHHNNAAHNQYTSQRTVEDTVIKETIPNKGKLASTGGMPLAGVGLLSLALVGLGVSVLRSAIRRER